MMRLDQLEKDCSCCTTSDDDGDVYCDDDGDDGDHYPDHGYEVKVNEKAADAAVCMIDGL